MIRLPAYAPDRNPAEGVWRWMKRGLTNTAVHGVDHLDTSAIRLEQLYMAAGGPTRSGSATATVTAALLDDLDVPEAINLAVNGDGDAARLLLRVLTLA